MPRGRLGEAHNRAACPVLRLKSWQHAYNELYCKMVEENRDTFVLFLCEARKEVEVLVNELYCKMVEENRDTFVLFLCEARKEVEVLHNRTTLRYHIRSPRPALPTYTPSTTGCCHGDDVTGSPHDGARRSSFPAQQQRRRRGVAMAMTSRDLRTMVRAVRVFQRSSSSSSATTTTPTAAAPESRDVNALWRQPPPPLPPPPD
ncbi:hypothetical protein QE152_g39462 [Popillia japonica]|uniref:Uncharacterized protein n=1 Tax=Popillia japonica TaxID=7064 RepID=A0AAW1HU69_POPJA